MRHLLTGIAARSLVALALMMAPTASEAQEPSLAGVLARATDYITALSDQLSGMVAEERYEQRSMGPATSRPSGVFPSDTYQRRTLRSDYLLIQPEGSEQYFGFRDVFEVDGRPVRHREDRLSRLFLDPSVSVQAQAQGILADSARYNIGDVQRNVNTPTLALLFLRSAYKPRVEFERVTGTPPRASDCASPTRSPTCGSSRIRKCGQPPWSADRTAGIYPRTGVSGLPPRPAVCWSASSSSTTSAWTRPSP